MVLEYNLVFDGHGCITQTNSQSLGQCFVVIFFSFSHLTVTVIPHVSVIVFFFLLWLLSFYFLHNAMDKILQRLIALLFPSLNSSKTDIALIKTQK